MATINNKLIHFKSKSDFDGRYAESTDGGITYGDFLGTSIVFIQDAKQIWTHGQFYDANKTTLASLGITATTEELNKLDGVTATTQELNYMDGVTSNVQTQLNDKAASNHTHTASQVSGLATVATTGSYNDLTDLPENSEGTYLLDLTSLGDLSSGSATGNIGSSAYTSLVNAINDNKLIYVLIETGTSTTTYPVGSGKIDSSIVSLNFSLSSSDYGFSINSSGTCIFAKSDITIDADQIISGTLDIARIPTGTTSSTVALGNHTHTEYLPLNFSGTAQTITLSYEGDPFGTQSIQLGTQNNVLKETFSRGSATLDVTYNLQGDSLTSIEWAQGDNSIEFNLYNDSKIIVDGNAVLTSGNYSEYITSSSIGALTPTNLENYHNCLVYNSTDGEITDLKNELPCYIKIVQGATDQVSSEYAWGLTFSQDGEAGIFLDTSTGEGYLAYVSDNHYSKIITENNINNYVSSTDTKNTTGTSNSAAKLFLAGGTSQDPTGVVTYSNSNVYTERGSMYAKSFYTTGVNNSTFVIDTMIGIVSSENRVASIGTTGIGTNKSIWVTSGVDDQATKTITLTGGTGTFSDKVNATNGFYETSDARLKNFKDDIKALDVVSEIPTKYFTWKKDEEVENVDPELHIGTSAQEIQKVYPDLVTENEEGELLVDYARLSVIALAAIKELKKEIDTLKSASVKYKF